MRIYLENEFSFMHHQVLLIILDGWGLGNKPEVSAISQARTPFIDSLFAQYPHSCLEASGLAVGLPEGQMGNSEVGHTNIGAGRIVYQDLVRINKSIAEGTLAQNPVLLRALEKAKTEKKKLHLIGLVSDGGVHAHLEHLMALCDIAQAQEVPEFYIHAFTDGRDTDPKSAARYLATLEKHLEGSRGKIASLVGRYYAMDRDKRWERIKIAYDLLVHGQGSPIQNIQEAIAQSYAEGISDEFLKPLLCTDASGKAVATIADGDIVLCFNFRTDRGRQLTEALTQRDFHEQNMHRLDLDYLTLTNYDESFAGIQVLFEKDNLHNTLGEVIAQAGKRQIRIAETEKYPHVTFFFSGGREEAFPLEKRILCPSPKVATYDLQPEMSAEAIKEAIVAELKAHSTDFVCLNFANPDMVGHTGVFEAAIKACEKVDACCSEVVQTALAEGYTCLIIADHGNADYMRNEDGSPHTAHTTNPVPCILVYDQEKYGTIRLKDGLLGNVAPTILELMGIAQAPEMNEGSLLIYSNKSDPVGKDL